MKKLKNLWLFCLIVLPAFMFIPTNTSILPDELQYDKMNVESLSTSSFVEHAPFILNGTDPDEFQAAITALGIPGLGTAADPYIIEGYKFTKAIEVEIDFGWLKSVMALPDIVNVSIGIFNVSDYIVIRDCIFPNVSIRNDAAIGAVDSGNITITNNTMDITFGAGISLTRTNDTVIRGNTMTTTFEGGQQSIFSTDTYNITIKDNTFINGTCLMVGVGNISIIDNYFTGMPKGGIPFTLFLNGSDVTIDNNTFDTTSGIYIDTDNNLGAGVDNINITNNILLNVNVSNSLVALGAIFVDGTSLFFGGGAGTGFMEFIRIDNNYIENCTEHGIYAKSGAGGIGIGGIGPQFLIRNNTIKGSGQGSPAWPHAFGGDGIYLDGTLNNVESLIAWNSILDNKWMGVNIYLASINFIMFNTITGHHQPAYLPPLPPAGGSFPSAGIWLDGAKNGRIESNLIHDNDYGIVIYGFIDDSSFNDIRINIITYNYYYAIMIDDQNGQSNQGNIITRNDIYANNMGNPTGFIFEQWNWGPNNYPAPPGPPPPAFPSDIFFSQAFDEFTLTGINTWGGPFPNYWLDPPPKGVLGPTPYLIDFGIIVPTPPPLIYSFETAPSGAPMVNQIPVVTPLNSTTLSMFNNSQIETKLVFQLSDPGIVFNGIEAYAVWNGTDPDFAFTTDNETFLEIRLTDLDPGNYSINCTFIDTMDVNDTREIKLTIVPNHYPYVTTPNSTAFMLNEWDLGDKGILVFNFTDIDKNIDVLRVIANLPGLSNSWFNESEGWVTYDIQDALPDGSYFVTVWVNDTGGLTDELTTTLNILPNHLPVAAENETSVSFEEGQERRVLWLVNDEDGNPDSYVIKINGTTVENGTWDGNDITIELNDYGLAPGIYNITCIVNDTLGEVAQASMTVTVTEISSIWESFWAWLSSAWESFWAWILSIFGITATAYGISKYRKKKRSECPCAGQPDCYCSI